jgi:hypothetical protein
MAAATAAIEEAASTALVERSQLRRQYNGRSYGGGRNVEGLIHESYLISDSLRIKIFSAHKTRSGKA